MQPKLCRFSESLEQQAGWPRGGCLLPAAYWRCWAWWGCSGVPRATLATWQGLRPSPPYWSLPSLPRSLALEPSRFYIFFSHPITLNPPDGEKTTGSREEEIVVVGVWVVFHKLGKGPREMVSQSFKHWFATQTFPGTAPSLQQSSGRPSKVPVKPRQKDPLWEVKGLQTWPPGLLLLFTRLLLLLVKGSHRLKA